jgi:hypothetical protein
MNEKTQTENDIILDEDKLYYHIPKEIFKPQNYDFLDIPPHAFTPQGKDGLSVNWEKYCPSAQDCLDIKTELYPNGRTNLTHGVGHFITKDIRKIEVLTVIYSPSLSNKAHSLITGLPPNKPKEPYNQMRKLLKRVFVAWDIEPLAPNTSDLGLIY